MFSDLTCPKPTPLSSCLPCLPLVFIDLIIKKPKIKIEPTFNYLFPLQEHKKKLAKMLGLQKEIHDHLSNLPDLTQLPDVTGGLAPLPSAGDLFNALH